MNKTFLFDELYYFSQENVDVNYFLLVLIVLLYIFSFILKYMYSLIFSEDVAN